jgi:hypothetical protein
MDVGDLIRWSAAASGIVAAIIVALNLGRRITGVGFVVFTWSSISWIVAGYLENLPSLITLNVALTIINILGVYRWLIRNSRE